MSLIASFRSRTSYLRGRGLALSGDTTDLLAHHDLTHWETKSGYPAMIGVVRDVAGEVVALHRTYLQVEADAPDTVTKAAVSKPRMMLGKVAGGAVRLAPINPGAALGLCEGIETGLAAMTSCPGLPVWATLSATNLEQVKLPPEAHRIVILADHDASGAGMRAAETAARRLRGEGRQVAIALPPGEGQDFNDVLLREGIEAVAAIVEAAFTVKEEEEEERHAPDATGRHLPIGFAEPNRPLPTLRADEGDLARAVDRAWSVLLASNRTPWLFQLPAIPEQPTAEDIAAARQLILDDFLGEFPFTSLAERAHAVSLLLLGFLRAMIDGPTPLHLIEKPTAGTGATLMVDGMATILTGTGAGVMTEGTDEEEWRKRITAKLRQIPTLVLIDNLKRQLEASALAAALTAPFWEDRILGISEITRLPIRCLWIATGNNPTFSNEMARRLVRIRLDARVDQPWMRDGFRHPDLMVWVRANRARLVAACLTLCRAWIAAGRPRGTRTIGSYESWSQTMGGVLEVAGIEGFLGNIDEMMAASDSEGAVWRSFVSAWWDRFGTAEVGTSDLYELALTAEPPLPLGSGNDRAQRTRLGKALGRMRDRVFRLGEITVRIEASGTYQGAQRWRLSTDEKMGTEERSRRSPESSHPVNVVNVGERGGANVHEKSLNEIKELDSVRERGERRERFSDPYTCAGARAPVREDPEKRSRRSPRSPDTTKSTTSGGEHRGERLDQRSPLPDPPAWLDGVP